MAAIFAIGKPVAFEASAIERETRGFISITTMRPFCRIDGELDVRSAGLDADLANDRERSVAHHLVFLVGQRLRGRDRDRIAGVHAHRIEILDRADDDAVVRAIAHHLHLEFLPADERLFDQDFGDRRQSETALDDLFEFLAIVGDAAAGAAERESRPNDERKLADLVRDSIGVGDGARDAGTREHRGRCAASLP